MVKTFKPEDAEGVLETVAWAAAEESALEIVGGGSKRALGRPWVPARAYAEREASYRNWNTLSAGRPGKLAPNSHTDYSPVSLDGL